MSSSLWSKLVEAQAAKKKRLMKVSCRRKVRNSWSCRRRPRSIMMKRRPRQAADEEGSRRPMMNPIEKKIKTLKKLIPNNDDELEPMGLDGLFRETADYILSLQMRVKVMQIMVKVLTGSESDDE
ncbi:hypothetical protein CCACVL1_24243 [Corchorus capsularis]|uniref:BHLH domain-containing protein n=1 Tax=Corchorus capsularis TaxID=210143 RepID=A0A1R3GQR1_COCAP|nr:hypothetical protein CCACVL1_24243 [Corchorus capsularis]